MRNTAVIMDDGINCLLESLGAYETEVFISNLIKEPFNYTEWQREHFANTTLEEFSKQAVQYDRDHPFR
ncbi:hypothetical protein AGMMS49940_21690 [Spirochaetia bacterium]|nr:hypothetical protein AGMMS49940_21690 [Spirochaetia bacterium]